VTSVEPGWDCNDSGKEGMLIQKLK